MKHRLLILLQLVFFFCADAQNQLGTESLVSRIDKYLNKSISNEYSASVLVAKNGKILLEKGYGMANRELNTPIKPSTIFNIGSVTKQFTAAGILKLQELNLLNVTDQIKQYFPQITDDKSAITIHHLLTHTSGIAPSAGGFRYQEAIKEDVLRELIQAPLMYVPGTRFTYANANYILLAAIIEKVAQQDYESFLKTNFWDPLQMDHTGYRSFTSKSQQLAHGYVFDETDGEWKDWGTTPDHLPNNGHHWFSIGKGDIQSSVEDLYKWHVALKKHTILSAEMKGLMESAHVPENEEETSYYGYGWAIFNTSMNKKIVTHNGSNRIYFADFIRVPEEDIVVIVLANIRLNAQSENTAWTILKMLEDDTFIPQPIPKNTYELVFDFIRSNSPEQAKELPQFLKKETGSNLKDKSVLNRIGYRQVYNKSDVAWGIELLKLNTALFPNDGNLWDSLGEAYYLINNKAAAVISFRKALELKPDEHCPWCLNASNRLQELSDN